MHRSCHREYDTENRVSKFQFERKWHLVKNRDFPLRICSPPTPPPPPSTLHVNPGDYIDLEYFRPSPRVYPGD